jgi:hypothetical protein
MRTYYIRRKDLSHVPFQYYVWADGRERPLDKGITSTFALTPPKGVYDVVHVLIVADFVQLLAQQWDIQESDVVRVAAKALEAWIKEEPIPLDHFYGPDFLKVDADWYPANADGSPAVALDPYVFIVETADPYPPMFEWPFFKSDSETHNVSDESVAKPATEALPRIVFGFVLDVFPGLLIVGQNQFKRNAADAGLRVSVSMLSLGDVPPDVAVVFVPRELVEAAQRAAPKAKVVALDSFLNHPAYKQIIAELHARQAGLATPKGESA